MPRRTVETPFGDRLRQLRVARGLSLRGLGRAVPCSHVHVRDLELGNKVPSPMMAARLDLVLGADGALAALAASALVQVGDGGWQPMATHFGRRDVEDLADALVAEAPTPGTALRLAHEWMLAEPPQVYELRSGRRVGAPMVGKVEQRIQQLRRLDDHVGGRDSHKVIIAELAATTDLLRTAAYTGKVGRRLLAALGELAQLAGWVASDAGRHGEAERLYMAGARAAHAGGDAPGAANNLSSLSYQIANIGRPRDAVVLARTAAAKVSDATGRTRALLLERAAWAHARAGEPTACERALDQVEDAYNGPSPEDPAWVYWLDPDEVEVMAGRCWTELERPLRAVPILRRATANYPEERARETALYLSWLAEALLQARELDEAASTALQTLALARKSHSARAVERTAVLRTRFQPLRGVPLVDEFEEAFLEG